MLWRKAEGIKPDSGLHPIQVRMSLTPCFSYGSMKPKNPWRQFLLEVRTFFAENPDA